VGENTLKIGRKTGKMSVLNTKTFSVKTPVFEGPLDLLLDLINKKKLFVNDVSLAQVTDDFIRYIEEHEEFPIGESAEFIFVASTLMLVKSHSLLPGLVLTEEEEESIEDLNRRLVMHAFFKELSLDIKQIYGKRIIFEKTPSRHQIVVFSPDSKTDINNLFLVLQNLISTLPKLENLPKATVQKIINLEETIQSLSERISKSLKMNFKEFYDLPAQAGVKGKVTREKKVSIIIGFLAMLELVKRGLIRVNQDTKGEIEMRKN